jgi:signal transduction histidine kinase
MISFMYTMKENMIHIYTECYSAIKKNEMICRNMHGSGEHHIEWDKPSSKDQISHSRLFVEPKLKMMMMKH